MVTAACKVVVEVGERGCRWVTGAGETASNAVYCGDFCRVMGAKALVVGGVLLVPVLVGVQVMKAVST